MIPRKLISVIRKQEYNDLGLGTQIPKAGSRFVNKDGSFNVKRRGVSFLESFSIYHSLIFMSWKKFMILIFITFISINILFALIYIAVGTDHLGGATSIGLAGRFSDAFFFSTQTFTTVGYGRINPTGFLTNIVASIESLMGLLAFAIVSGVMFGRFARPNIKILFSKNAIIAPYQDISGFEFRIANARNNQLLDVEVQVALSRTEILNGKGVRKYYELTLERKKIEFFPTAWTIVHPIDEQSPLYKVTKEELEFSDAEFLILIKAFDDGFFQQVHKRSSYKFDEVIIGARFLSIIKQNDGETLLELNRISEFELADLKSHVEQSEKKI